MNIKHKKLEPEKRLQCIRFILERIRRNDECACNAPFGLERELPGALSFSMTMAGMTDYFHGGGPTHEKEKSITKGILETLCPADQELMEELMRAGRLGVMPTNLTADERARREDADRTDAQRLEKYAGAYLSQFPSIKADTKLITPGLLWGESIPNTNDPGKWTRVASRLAKIVGTTHDFQTHTSAILAASLWATSAGDSLVALWRIAALCQLFPKLRLKSGKLVRVMAKSQAELQREEDERACRNAVKRIGKNSRVLSQRLRNFDDQVQVVIILIKRGKLVLPEAQSLARQLRIPDYRQLKKSDLYDKLVNRLEPVSAESGNGHI